jgi:ubiquinone biosynthesis monooxygenase Coq7
MLSGNNAATDVERRTAGPPSVDNVSNNFAAGACRRCLSMLSTLDRTLVALDTAMKTLGCAARAARPLPPAPPAALSDAECRLSGALMRVNHVGEVCAQALYQAQALTARSAALRDQMAAAAREETDHLAWTERRLRDLGARPSLLNPLWYAGAFAIGLAAGRAGDRWSLGFVVETERQVEQHLAGHLTRLPERDSESRAVVAQMKDDEARHADSAQRAGGAELPRPWRLAMRLAAKAMTATAHHI